MLKQRFIPVVALAMTLVIGMQATSFAFGGTKKKSKATFKIRIENIANRDGLLAQDGTKYPFALSPGA